MYCQQQPLLSAKVSSDLPHALTMFSCVQLVYVSAKSHGVCCCVTYTSPSLSPHTLRNWSRTRCSKVSKSVSSVCSNWMRLSSQLYHCRLGVATWGPHVMSYLTFVVSHMTCVSGHMTCVSGHMTCVPSHMTCVPSHMTCVSGHMTCVGKV